LAAPAGRFRQRVLRADLNSLIDRTADIGRSCLSCGCRRNSYVCYRWSARVSFEIVMLTEREHELGELTARADQARAGSGGVVIVGGESGAGKTSFVETFLDRSPHHDRVLWGACDPLSTPRPLGPIHDLADHFEPATQNLLRDSDRPYEVFAAVFEELATRPSVLVIDDLQWADQATVDLLRFMLRRMGARVPWQSGLFATMRSERPIHCARCSATSPVPAMPRRCLCHR
jgi:predicted ATPase